LNERLVRSLTNTRPQPRVRRLTMALLIWAAVLASWFGSGLWLQKEVTIRLEGRELSLGTAGATVAEALEDAGVSLGPRDEVHPAPGHRLRDGLTIVIRRARPVTFILDGRRVTILSAARTVGGVLDGSRLPVRSTDRLVPGRNTPVREDLEVAVTRVVHTYRHRLDPIPFPTVKKEDMSLLIGQTVVVQEGTDGLVHRLRAVTLENGVEVSSREISSRVLAEPTARIIRVGTAGTIVRDGRTIEFLKAMRVRATAYEPGPISCGESADGYTAVGLKATRGIVAVDPRVIPLWTQLYVDGYGYAVAGDVGSAIKGQRIDVCFDTYDEAIRWGVRYVNVYILELPGP